MRRHFLAGLSLAVLGACATGYRPAVVHDMGAMTPERVSHGLLRRYITAEKSTMAIYDMRKGAKVPVHAHSSEQVSYVQQGRLRFIVGGEAHNVRAGQVIVIPAHAPHSIEALETSIEIDFFSPPRSSWIEDRDESMGDAQDLELTGPPGTRRP